VSRESGIWVFGYGSLMWRPGFRHDEAAHAIVHGLHRALCVYSFVHRGTQQRPGLVLGLDAGGWCEGWVFHVPPVHVHETLGYLRRREQINNVYRAMWKTVSFRDDPHREVRALLFAVNRCHRQYAGRLPYEKQEWLVRRSIGRSGRNIEYVVNTVRHLRECGIHDARLEALIRRRRPSASY
jgi:cation transport protein ChaC